MLSPGCRVVRYLPNRSTTPARACGTMRIVCASSTITKIARTASSESATDMVSSSGELRTLEHVGRGALDADDVHDGPGRDRVLLQVWRGGPLLAADLDATGL